MNQFKEFDFNGNEQALEVAKDFDYILNNIWSTYSEAKGVKRWKEIKGRIPYHFSRGISIEMIHVELGYGREQALMAVKHEMIKYLEYLIK